MNDSLYDAYIYAFDFIVLGYRVPKFGPPKDVYNRKVILVVYC